MSKELSDVELKKQLMDNLPDTAVKKADFPTEVITLPSKGYFYAKDNILSSGEIELRYPTAKDEDILTSRNLIQKGIVMDKFFRSIIVTPINYDDLLLGDRNGIMYAARILAYGSDYDVNIQCPSCNVKNDIHIDLTDLKSKEILFDEFEKGQQEFNFTLPIAKKNVVFKLLTYKDDKQIEQEIKAIKKVNPGRGDILVTSRLKHAIVEFDGERDKRKINNFVDNLLSQDSLALRIEFLRFVPDIDSKIDFECNDCGYVDNIAIPMDLSFFWPSGRL